MDSKQVIAIGAPVILVGMMYPIFQFLSKALGERVGWYLGTGTIWWSILSHVLGGMVMIF